MDVRVVYVGLMRDVEPFGPSLAQMVERLTVEGSASLSESIASINWSLVRFR